MQQSLQALLAAGEPAKLIGRHHLAVILPEQTVLPESIEHSENVSRFVQETLECMATKGPRGTSQIIDFAGTKHDNIYHFAQTVAGLFVELGEENLLVARQTQLSSTFGAMGISPTAKQGISGKLENRLYRGRGRGKRSAATAPQLQPSVKHSKPEESNQHHQTKTRVKSLLSDSFSILQGFATISGPRNNTTEQISERSSISSECAAPTTTSSDSESDESVSQSCTVNDSESWIGLSFETSVLYNHDKSLTGLKMSAELDSPKWAFAPIHTQRFEVISLIEAAVRGGEITFEDAGPIQACLTDYLGPLTGKHKEHLDKFHELCGLLQRALSMDSDTCNILWRLLFAQSLLGSVEYGPVTTSQVSSLDIQERPTDSWKIVFVANSFHVEPMALSRALCQRRVRAGKRTSVMLVSRTPAQARLVTVGLCKTIFESCFQVLVRTCNRCFTRVIASQTVTSNFSSKNPVQVTLRVTAPVILPPEEDRQQQHHNSLVDLYGMFVQLSVLNNMQSEFANNTLYDSDSDASSVSECEDNNEVCSLLDTLKEASTPQLVDSILRVIEDHGSIGHSSIQSLHSAIVSILKPKQEHETCNSIVGNPPKCPTFELVHQNGKQVIAFDCSDFVQENDQTFTSELRETLAIPSSVYDGKPERHTFIDEVLETAALAPIPSTATSKARRMFHLRCAPIQDAMQRFVFCITPKLPSDLETVPWNSEWVRAQLSCFPIPGLESLILDNLSITDVLPNAGGSSSEFEEGSQFDITRTCESSEAEGSDIGTGDDTCSDSDSDSDSDVTRSDAHSDAINSSEDENGNYKDVNVPAADVPQVLNDLQPHTSSSYSDDDSNSIVSSVKNGIKVDDSDGGNNSSGVEDSDADMNNNSGADDSEADSNNSGEANDTDTNNKSIKVDDSDADSNNSCETDDSDADNNNSNEVDDSNVDNNNSNEVDDADVDNNNSNEADDSDADSNNSIESYNSDVDNNNSNEADDSDVDHNWNVEATDSYERDDGNSVCHENPDIPSDYSRRSSLSDAATAVNSNARREPQDSTGSDPQQDSSLDDATTTITKCWRGFLERKRYQLNLQHIVLLQSIVRRHLVRKRYEHIIRVRDRASITIQCWARTVAAQRAVALRIEMLQLQAEYMESLENALKPNEFVVFTGMVVKHASRGRNRSRQLVFTTGTTLLNQPRLLYIDPKSGKVKGEIVWDPSTFCVWSCRNKFKIWSLPSGRKFKKEWTFEVWNEESSTWLQCLGHCITPEQLLSGAPIVPRSPNPWEYTSCVYNIVYEGAFLGFQHGSGDGLPSWDASSRFNRRKKGSSSLGPIRALWSGTKQATTTTGSSPSVTAHSKLAGDQTGSCTWSSDLWIRVMKNRTLLWYADGDLDVPVGGITLNGTSQQVRWLPRHEAPGGEAGCVALWLRPDINPWVIRANPESTGDIRKLVGAIVTAGASSRCDAVAYSAQNNPNSDTDQQQLGDELPPSVVVPQGNAPVDSDHSSPTPRSSLNSIHSPHVVSPSSNLPHTNETTRGLGGSLHSKSHAVLNVTHDDESKLEATESEPNDRRRWSAPIGKTKWNQSDINDKSHNDSNRSRTTVAGVEFLVSEADALFGSQDMERAASWYLEVLVVLGLGAIATSSTNDTCSRESVGSVPIREHDDPGAGLSSTLRQTAMHCYNRLVQCWVIQGNSDKALSFCQQGLLLCNTDRELLLRQAVVYKTLGAFSQCLDSLRRVFATGDRCGGASKSRRSIGDPLGRVALDMVKQVVQLLAECNSPVQAVSKEKRTLRARYPYYGFNSSVPTRVDNPAGEVKLSRFGLLQFDQGDEIEMIASAGDGEWWLGKCHGRLGFFPLAYVELG